MSFFFLDNLLSEITSFGTLLQRLDGQQVRPLNGGQNRRRAPTESFPTVADQREHRSEDVVMLRVEKRASFTEQSSRRRRLAQWRTRETPTPRNKSSRRVTGVGTAPSSVSHFSRDPSRVLVVLDVFFAVAFPGLVVVVLVVGLRFVRSSYVSSFPWL